MKEKPEGAFANKMMPEHPGVVRGFGEDLPGTCLRHNLFVTTPGDGIYGVGTANILVMLYSCWFC